MSTPGDRSRIELPPIPDALRDAAVAVWEEPLVIDSYLPEEPHAFPAFLGKRVYQGSSGRVYPLPFHERVDPEKRPRAWRAVHLENEWLRLVVLPELGGRLHIAYDKRNDYDLFYRNNVLKPALVGLAGPWISGGVEFNWPQHHRPATFLPTEVEIEREDDGAVTVWCADHDPFARMRGRHGIRLRPDSSRIEARVRLTNRTEVRRTFLWWANVAVAVDDDYQSVFPRDVAFVADHARRAVTRFPHPDSPYYGIDYGADRTPADDRAGRLDWYRNIPVPTSYMVTETAGEFFGGYDHARGGGFVHWADRAVSPGKKMWTWGNAPFGWAWDRNLTDDDGPYIELMAGVFTDNQPDFAYLAPGETKSFSQYWFPIAAIGPVHQATDRLAVHVDVTDTTAAVGIIAAEAITVATVRVSDGRRWVEEGVRLAPSAAVHLQLDIADLDPATLELRVEAPGGEPLRVELGATSEPRRRPRSATAPPPPPDVETIDELVQIARYLEQYRHATRSSEPYWDEALRRDPGESRAALGLAHRAYSRADYDEAERLARASLERRTRWAPTPIDGEAHLLMGYVLVRTGRDEDAEEYLARAAWDSTWTAAATDARIRLLARTGRLDRAIATATDLRADRPRDARLAALTGALLRAAGRHAAADDAIRDALAADPLEPWARVQAGLRIEDPTLLLDVAIEFASVSLLQSALAALDLAAAALPQTPVGQINIGPLIDYHRADLLDRSGETAAADESRGRAARGTWIHCAPARLEDVDALRRAAEQDPADALAHALLGDWYFHVDRASDAVAEWRSAIAGTIEDALATVVHRNLGIALFNSEGDADAAVRHYAVARSLRPRDAKLLYESDQLALRTGATAAERLAVLEIERAVLGARDDLVVSYAELLLDAGRIDDADTLLRDRRFQPWEGGEGRVIRVWDRLCLARAAEALDDGDGPAARDHVLAALRPPETLGEDRHPLSGTAELHLMLGDALDRIGEHPTARVAWEEAAASVGDFARMSAAPFGTQTVYAIQAMRRLGHDDRATELMASLTAWVDRFAAEPADVDYFATSLPALLLFEENPERIRDREVEMIRAQLVALREPVGG